MPATTARLTRGIGAAALLAVLLVGIPTALWVVAGSPIPTTMPSWARIQSTLSNPDVTGTLLLGILKYAGWIAWATFALAVLIEIPSALRGATAPRMRGLGAQQRAAASLVTAVITMLAIGPTVATAAPASAAVHTPTTSVSLTQATTTPTAQADDEADVDVVGQTPPAPAPALATYTVARGDSLWRIAEQQLGDGTRFQEIADLNYGVVQADGYALDASHWIEPGWVLTLPIEAAAQAVPDTTGATHVVAPGESLYEIAANELGDGNRYPELVEATKDIVQPDGAHLGDPSLIRPGWQITIPTTTPAPTPVPAVPETAPETDPAPAAAVSDPAPPATDPLAATDTTTMTDGEQAPIDDTHTPTTTGADTTTGAEAETETATRAETEAPATETGTSISVGLSAGIGGLLAAGILTLLTTKRNTARRRRKPGQRIPTPNPTTPPARLETELRAIATHHTRDTINTALRALAAWHQDQDLALPDVRAARLTPDLFELYLDTPATLPAPWTSQADGALWQITPAQVDQLPPTAGEGPYPSLVTIGQVDDDATLLLDLERVGCLSIRGDNDTTTGVLAALAFELATTPWADDLQITLVGTLATLPGAIDTGRLRHIPTIDGILHELRARAEATTNALNDLGVTTLTEARGRGLATDLWTPEILLIGEPLNTTQQTALTDLVTRIPAVGIAAVTTHTNLTDWVLDHNDPTNPTHAKLLPAGLPIRTQRLTTDQYIQALTLLADTTPIPGPTWAPTHDTEPALADIPVVETVVAAVGDGGVDELADGAGEDLGELDVTVDRPLNPLPGMVEFDAATAGPTTTGNEPTHADDAAEGEGEGALVTTLHSPRLCVMGPITLTGTRGPDLTSHTGTIIELIAYLAFNPGATGEEISAALWPTSTPSRNTRNPRISQARKWLGTNADGDHYLPIKTTTTTGYNLQGITTDWADFLALIGDDITTTPLPNLTAALNLVTGTAFQGAPPRKYAWADPIAQEITAGIVDVAHETARRALAAGDTTTARHAARIGRLADPIDERSWRDGIRAEHASGRYDAVDRLITQLQDHLDALELDTDPETDNLIAEIDTHRKTRERRRQSA